MGALYLVTTWDNRKYGVQVWPVMTAKASARREGDGGIARGHTLLRGIFPGNESCAMFFACVNCLLQSSVNALEFRYQSGEHREQIVELTQFHTAQRPTRDAGVVYLCGEKSEITASCSREARAFRTRYQNPRRFASGGFLFLGR